MKLLSAVEIGEKLKNARKARGLSQADLAQRLDVSQPNICNWEAGEYIPPYEDWQRIADILDARIEDLFFDEPKKKAL